MKRLFKKRNEFYVEGISRLCGSTRIITTSGQMALRPQVHIYILDCLFDRGSKKCLCIAVKSIKIFVTAYTHLDGNPNHN